MFFSGQTQDCLFHISDWGKFLWKTFISRYICYSQVSTHPSDICSQQIHLALCNRHPDGILCFFSQSCLRTSSILAMSSKCLLFPIFIYKVVNENCCVYNSNVAINVTILITSSFFSVFFWLYSFCWLCYAWVNKYCGCPLGGTIHPLSTTISHGWVLRECLHTTARWA